ncbi:MAG: NAD(P)H-hydrate dehydratase [Thermodesulfobacteriota bacterium]
MKVMDAVAMRAMDERALSEYAMKGLQLMENAGRSVAEVVLRELASKGGEVRRVAIICGKGNNGGDGFVCARHLQNAGVEVTVFSLTRPGNFKGDSGVNVRCWQKMGGAVNCLKSSADLTKQISSMRHAHVVVDAVLGTGLTSAVEGFYGEVLEFINTVKGTVISIDVPSGMNATTGEVDGAAVRAGITVTMALPKLGFYLAPGSGLTGRVEVADIGMPASMLTDKALKHNLITAESVSSILMPRRAETHKCTYGHVALLGGSPGKTGAPYMAAMGAMRCGAGLLTIGLPAGLNNIMECKTTEVMTWALPEDNKGTIGEEAYGEIKELLQGKAALVAGPGLGVSTGLKALLKSLIGEVSLPVVLDADVLNNFAGSPDDLKGAASREVVLTPHPGEAARLLGVSTADIQGDRIGMAAELAKRAGALVVLKGFHTIIAAPDGEIYINTTGGPALATAGTGDVLAGMIGGLLGQGQSAVHSAITAVYIHGLAGDVISNRHGGPKGLIATELLAELPRLLNSLTHE